MANYYDLMVRHAFGNYRDLLYDVATHPVMGIYLSHLGNRKADSAKKIYPDENFAREIMQLFTLGLWRLNSDGTRQRDANGEFLATYNNSDITELARVFTGLSLGNNSNFDLYPRDFTRPMKMWDAEHDCNAKTLLSGLQLPARLASAGNLGLAGLADVNAAVSNLFVHPNVGPFIGRQLIQRLVTSNPSTRYVARVAAAFADNGVGVRGDMKAIVRAILLDAEARDPDRMLQSTWGKLREPLLRVVNYARAFNAASIEGYYPISQFTLDHLQDPMSPPSVFNFFLPTHSPPGPLTQLGLVAPEFQIINASTAITGPNYFWNSIPGDLHHYGTANPNYAVRLNLTQELSLIVPAAQISLDGGNVWQTGNTVAEYAITPEGAVGLSGYNAAWKQYQDVPNALSAAVDSQLSQQYSNLLAQTFNASKRQALDAYAIFANATAAPLPPQVSFPDTYVGQRLAMIARAIQGRSGIGARRQTFFIQWGGWDHHSDVLSNQAEMLPQISEAIGAFQNAMAALKIEDQVTLFTASDFGRTLTSNGRGSDHAWGGNQLVVGGAVKGKRIYGVYPSLKVKS